VIIFVTDGLPTVGETDQSRILAQIDESERSRIFSFGVGAGVNTQLLDGIAEKTRAFSQYVGAKEDLELKLSSFFARIKDPVMTDLELKVDGPVKFETVYPRSLPDLFSGDQLVVTGRFTGTGRASVRLAGKVLEKDVENTFETEFSALSDSNEFVPRLWATRRVAWLLDEIRAKREEKEIVDEITSLARDFGIITPYTAYLIMEDEAKRDVPMTQRSFKEMERSELPRAVGKAALDSYKDSVEGDAAVASASGQNAMKYAGSGNASGGSLDLRKSNSEFRSAFEMSASAAPVAERADEFARATQQIGNVNQSTKRAGGRTFVQNGRQWVDTRAQGLKDAKMRRVQFDSAEYYELLASHPETGRWLALGQNLLLEHNNELIEIFE
jgi:Ca-activated chloride channel family protein